MLLDGESLPTHSIVPVLLDPIGHTPLPVFFGFQWQLESPEEARAFHSKIESMPHHLLEVCPCAWERTFLSEPGPTFFLFPKKCGLSPPFRQVPFCRLSA